MSDVNFCIIGGNITKDPGVKYTPNTNTAVCQFTIASNDKYKDKESVCFMDCQAWGKTAEFVAKYLKKGSKVIAEGKMQQQSWDDKETGKKRYRTFLNINKIQSIDTKKKEEPREPGDEL